MHTDSSRPVPAMAPVAPGDRRVVNIHTDAFRPLPRADGSDGGESVLHADPTRDPGFGFHVYRMQPGCVTEPHRHGGAEHFLVLDGTVIDHDGTRYGPGDLVWLADGTIHNSHAPDGALLVVWYGDGSEPIDG